MDSPIDFESIKGKVKSTRIIMAKDDPYVPVEDSKIFMEKLDAKIKILPLSTHFTEDDGYNEFPIALDEFIKLANGI